MKKRITDKLSRAQKVERAPRMRAAVKSDVSDDGLGKKINEQACHTIIPQERMNMHSYTSAQKESLKGDKQQPSQTGKF